MAKSLSLAELTALYANKGSNPKALFEKETNLPLNTALPGVSTAEKLQKLFYTRQNGLLSVRPKAWASASDHNTIAICVVIVDSLHHEDIWKQWIEQNETNLHHTEIGVKYKAELFIHAKYPEKVTSEWVKERLIDVTFRPEWNSVEVVQSLLSVLSTALKYTPGTPHVPTQNAQDEQIAQNTASATAGACGRFLLATESCLPLYDLQTTGEMLFAEESSWLNAYHTPQGSWEAGACFRAVDADIVPPKAVWKSLPGWIVLSRLHAQDIVTLSSMLGGWGVCSDSTRGAGGTGAYSNLCDPAYLGSFQGTKAARWREEKSVAVGTATSTVTESKEAAHSTIATPDATTTTTTTTITTTTITTNATAQQPALLSAWGAGGSWHERNGSVFAPEEVFFPTVLSLLGYLRDTSSTDANSSSKSSTDNNGVRIATVTFAEWRKKGDANPIQYDHFDAQTVTRMRASGAAFGRKFSRGSVNVEQWSSVLRQIDASVSSIDGSNSGSRGRYGGRDSRDRDRDRDRYNNGGSRGDYAYNDRYNSGDKRSNYDRNDNYYNSNSSSGDRYQRNNDNYYGGDRDRNRDSGSFDPKRRKY